MTELERAREELAKLRQDRAKAEAALAEAEDSMTEALLTGKRIVDPALVEAEAKIRLLGRAIAMTEETVAALERQEADRRLAEIERAKEGTARELAAAHKRYEAAREEFMKAEREYDAVHYKLTAHLESLNREMRTLTARLQPERETEAGEGPEPDPQAVQERLQALREGRNTTVLLGQDPALDEAFELYQREIREIQAWHRRDLLSRRSTGESVPPPECAAHYSKEQLQAIIKKAEAKGKLAAVEEGDPSLLLRPTQVTV